MYKLLTRKLDNHLEILSCPNPYLHSVMISLYFHAGITYESKKINGISHLLEHLCFRDLNGISQKSLYSRTEQIGANLRGITCPEYMVFSIKVSPEFFHTAMDILAYFFYPYEWTQEEILLEKEVVLNQIKYQSDNSMQKRIETMYLDGTNFELPVMGTEKTINRLAERDLILWKNKIFQPVNACLCITGHHSQSEIDYAVDKLAGFKNNDFEGFNKKAKKPKNFGQRTKKSDNFLDTDWDFYEVTILFDIDDTIDTISVDFLSSILGEGVGAKLGLSLRENLGYTDEIFSEVKTNSVFQWLQIEYTVDKRGLIPSIEECIRIVNESKYDVTQNELMSSVQFFTTNKHWNLDDVDIMDSLIGRTKIQYNEYYDMQQDIRQYGNITVDNIKKAAQSLFSSHNLIINVAGNINKEFRSQIEDCIIRCRNILM